MLLGQCGAQWGNRVTKAGLRNCNDVHIAFDHNDPARLARCGRTFVQIVERPPLVEQRRIGGIEIFGLTIAQYPAAKSNHTATRVANGYHQPAAKPVVRILALNRDQQPRLNQHRVAIVLQC